MIYFKIRLMVASLNKTIAMRIKATQTKRPQTDVLCNETKTSICRYIGSVKDLDTKTVP